MPKVKKRKYKKRKALINNGWGGTKQRIQNSLDKLFGKEATPRFDPYHVGR